MKSIIFCIIISIGLLNAKESKPNIILIMADDMGYECVEANGGEDYKTPRLNAMARSGVRFTNAYANPICTPSRVKIMTGMYNVRNYVAFGILDRNQKTFAHYLKEAGYKTSIAGKWQLGKNADSAQHFGFDESLLWQHTRPRHREGTQFDSRHVNPRLERNGKPVDYDNGEFASDLFVDFLNQFMTENKDGPFFAYFPMVLPHCPFVPTPSSKDYDPSSHGSPTYKGDPLYFGNMVEYIDTLVGQIEDKVNELKIADNTIIIFTCDNGTDRPIKTNWNGKQISSGKGTMTDQGHRVPFIVKFPKKFKEGAVTQSPIDFADILPTLCELAGVKHGERIDGSSIMPLLKGKERSKDYAYIFFEPKSGSLEKAKVMARTSKYEVMRKGLKGEYVFSDCKEAYAAKKIPAANRNEEQQQAFDKLRKIIEAKDKLYRSELK